MSDDRYTDPNKQAVLQYLQGRWLVHRTFPTDACVTGKTTSESFYSEWIRATLQVRYRFESSLKGLNYWNATEQGITRNEFDD